MDLEALKRKAAERALEEVQSGMRLGLGTGSTVAHLLDALGEAIAAGRIENVVGVPTSIRTQEHAKRVGIPLAELADLGTLDLCIDGADEVDPNLDLIKGLGGALLREKMVASAASRFVVIADETKIVDRLGTRSPLPVEVVPFAHEVHAPWLAEQGCPPAVRLVSEADPEPYRTDNGNLVLDARAAEGGFADPEALARALEARPGVVEHGFFLGMCNLAVIAAASGVRTLERPE